MPVASLSAAASLPAMHMLPGRSTKQTTVTGDLVSGDDPRACQRSRVHPMINHEGSAGSALLCELKKGLACEASTGRG